MTPPDLDGVRRAGSTRLDRRSALLAAVLGTGALTSAACSASRPESDDQMTSPSASPSGSPGPSRGGASRVLLAYFSRPGENYYYGGRTDLEVGNTEVLARMIVDRIGCDVYEIEAAEPYSRDYDATVQRNVEEQDADARPGIRGALPDPSGYDVVLLASPIWNVRPPMIMHTLAEGLDLGGRTVHPVVTYAVSGLGRAKDDYTEACPGATIGAGLAVRGEEVADAGPDLDAWLADNGLLQRN